LLPGHDVGNWDARLWGLFLLGRDGGGHRQHQQHNARFHDSSPNSPTSSAKALALAADSAKNDSPEGAHDHAQIRSQATLAMVT
jgi:hypothetical protein